MTSKTTHHMVAANEDVVPAIDSPEGEIPIAVEIRDGVLWVTLKDGRVIGTPLEWYKRLAGATPEQLADVRLTPFGIHWPDLDEDLSVRGMLGIQDPLDAVMTVKEVAEEYSITRYNVHDAIRHDWLPARKSGGTWLIRRADAEARWGGP
jgi:hypothetical protein